MARTYDVNGVKTYLIAAFFLFGIGLWHAFDGWVEQEHWLEKHPKVELLSFVEGGTVEVIHYAVGDKVKAGAVIAELEQLEDKKGENLIAKRKLASTKSGWLDEIDFEVGDTVQAELVVGEVRVRDSFYLYNKVTAVASLLAAVVCLIIHFRVR